MATARVRRGRTTQALVAQWFAARGWPQAESRAASLPGEDVLGMGDVSIEVKASSRFNLIAALRQSKTNANGKLPLVIYRPDGFGEAAISDWLVAMRLEDATHLLVRAGYAQTVVPDDAA